MQEVEDLHYEFTVPTPIPRVGASTGVPTADSATFPTSAAATQDTNQETFPVSANSQSVAEFMPPWAIIATTVAAAVLLSGLVLVVVWLWFRQNAIRHAVLTRQLTVTEHSRMRAWDSGEGHSSAPLSGHTYSNSAALKSSADLEELSRVESTSAHRMHANAHARDGENRRPMSDNVGRHLYNARNIPESARSGERENRGAASEEFAAAVSNGSSEGVASISSDTRKANTHSSSIHAFSTQNSGSVPLNSVAFNVIKAAEIAAKYNGGGGGGADADADPVAPRFLPSVHKSYSFAKSNHAQQPVAVPLNSTPPHGSSIEAATSHAAEFANVDTRVRFSSNRHSFIVPQEAVSHPTTSSASHDAAVPWRRFNKHLKQMSRTSLEASIHRGLESTMEEILEVRRIDEFFDETHQPTALSSIFQQHTLESSEFQVVDGDAAVDIVNRVSRQRTRDPFLDLTHHEVRFFTLKSCV